MQVIWDGNSKRILEDRPCLLKIHSMDPKVPFSLLIIPLK